MNNFMLSIDPSLKNTGFILWKKEKCYEQKEFHEMCNKNCKDIRKPIWLGNYNFKKYGNGNFIEKIIQPIINIISNGYKIEKYSYHLEDLYIFIESGFHKNNKNTTQQLDWIRGNIFGLFFQILTKDKIINPNEWQSWYKKEFPNIYKNENFGKWDKELSIKLTKMFINLNNWNIDIKNDYDIADALLIGWYVINNNLVK